MRKPFDLDPLEVVTSEARNGRFQGIPVCVTSQVKFRSMISGDAQRELLLHSFEGRALVFRRKGGQLTNTLEWEMLSGIGGL